mmetsp:Transcript_7562/g.13371  ORF Transcript_7562/g.13371 Transcript_7562/m.13371 type:complete len:101 (+) Transcript_7562:72-374(+)
MDAYPAIMTKPSHIHKQLGKSMIEYKSLAIYSNNVDISDEKEAKARLSRSVQRLPRASGKREHAPSPRWNLDKTISPRCTPTCSEIEGSKTVTSPRRANK